MLTPVDQVRAAILQISPKEFTNKEIQLLTGLTAAATSNALSTLYRRKKEITRVRTMIVEYSDKPVSVWQNIKTSLPDRATTTSEVISLAGWREIFPEFFKAPDFAGRKTVYRRFSD